MPVNQFNKDFAKQFYQEYAPYTGIIKQQHDSLLFRQFSGNEQELALLGKQLSGRIHDAHLISHFINKLEKCTIPEAARLSVFIKKLNKLLSNYAEIEPYTATYYNNLTQALTGFLEQTNTFQKDADEHLVAKLKMPFDVERGQEFYLDIDSDVIRKIEEVIECYLNNFGTYEHYFNSLIQHESGTGQGIALTTQVAHYLSELVLLTEGLIEHLQSIREILFTWEQHMANRELQELYN